MVADFAADFAADLFGVNVSSEIDFLSGDKKSTSKSTHLPNGLPDSVPTSHFQG